MPHLDYDGTVTATVSISSFETAIPFYRDVLGLELLMHEPQFNWAEFQSPTPNCTIGIGVDPERAGDSRRPNSAIVLGVRDLAAARSALEGAGVRFEGENMEVPGMVRLATFFDPDGNTLMLVQSLA